MTERLILGQVLRLEADPALTGPEAAQHETPRRAAHQGRPDRRDRPAHASVPPIPPARRRPWRAPDPARFHRRPCPLPADRDHRLLGQAADRLAQHLHLPRRDAVFRPRLRAGSRTATSTSCSPTARPRSAATAPSIRKRRRALHRGAGARHARLAGKTCMDRDTAPEGLRDTAQSAYDDSKALLRRWHGRGRLSYVITPRFSPPRPRRSSTHWARSGPSIPTA
jgi:hypothetical protein